MDFGLVRTVALVHASDLMCVSSHADPVVVGFVEVAGSCAFGARKSVEGMQR